MRAVVRVSAHTLFSLLVFFGLSFPPPFFSPFYRLLPNFVLLAFLVCFLSLLFLFLRFSILCSLSLILVFSVSLVLLFLPFLRAFLLVDPFSLLSILLRGNPRAGKQFGSRPPCVDI